MPKRYKYQTYVPKPSDPNVPYRDPTQLLEDLKRSLEAPQKRGKKRVKIDLKKLHEKKPRKQATMQRRRQVDPPPKKPGILKRFRLKW